MSYYRVNLSERQKIDSYLRIGTSITQISSILDRSKSTISREIKRGTINDLYSPDHSENRFIAGLSRNKALFLDKDLRDFVIDKLVNHRWSPAAIAGRLRAFSELGLKASYETIYKFAFSEEGISLSLPSYLRRKKKVRGLSRRKGKRNTIIGLRPISTPNAWLKAHPGAIGVW